MPEIIAPEKPWRTDPLILEERAREIERAESESRAARRHLCLRFGGEYVFWFFLGLSAMFFSFRFADPEYAKLELWSGILLGDAGMLSVLVRLQAYREKHGLR